VETAAAARRDVRPIRNEGLMELCIDWVLDDGGDGLSLRSDRSPGRALRDTIQLVNDDVLDPPVKEVNGRLGQAGFGDGMDVREDIEHPANDYDCGSEEDLSNVPDDVVAIFDPQLMQWLVPEPVADGSLVLRKINPEKGQGESRNAVVEQVIPGEAGNNC
jgi:hypothetical protein